MTRNILHLSVGPVQDFVRQARRTRDLWAGSFLLSWLSGTAMKAVRDRGGTITFPAVTDKSGEITDPLLIAVNGNPEAAKFPHIGSLPNRFRAEVGDDFQPATVESTVREAWEDLADAVWEVFVEEVADSLGSDTDAIWKRQITSFWEIQWVLGPSGDADQGGTWLAARKNWRHRWPATEGGEHCTLMGDYQEISGHLHGRKQRDFWAEMQDRVGRLDIRDDEKLCSIALVKRLFPRLAKAPPNGRARLEEAMGWVPGDTAEAVGNWPSTAYMAAVPWLRLWTEDTRDATALHNYSDAVAKEAGAAVRGERAADIASLRTLGTTAWLDGNFFIKSALSNAKATPLGKDNAEQLEGERGQLIEGLSKLNKQVGHATDPYYALLLVDGDKLGALLEKHDPELLSNALADFTGKVPGVVSNNDGVTLYAGGDDVLAMLPVDTALECALALREQYHEAFTKCLGSSYNERKMTVSAAVAYAHYHLPLRGILSEAHRQLDEIAKDRNGRGSLALALLKPSGDRAEWVAAWSHNDMQPPLTLRTFSKAVHDHYYSAGFFYNLRRRYPAIWRETGSNAALLGEETVTKLLIAEYLQSKVGTTPGSDAEDRVQNLLKACRQYPGGARSNGQHLYQFGGIAIARFLAREGLAND